MNELEKAAEKIRSARAEMWAVSAYADNIDEGTLDAIAGTLTEALVLLGAETNDELATRSGGGGAQ